MAYRANSAQQRHTRGYPVPRWSAPNWESLNGEWDAALDLTGAWHTPDETAAHWRQRLRSTTTRRDRSSTADVYQAMPKQGYTRMFERMLAHPNITILLNTDYREIEGAVLFDQVICTGPIDEYFDCQFGRLPYRSLDFQHETLDASQVQEVAVVNYPNDHLYTRVTEFKHLTGQSHPKTARVYEYPKAEGDPYYPIPRAENAALYKKFQELADDTPGVHFVGRLGTYRYYNMDQVVAQALTLFSKIAGVRRSECVAA